jgi:hypothetical protein
MVFNKHIEIGKKPEDSEFYLDISLSNLGYT